MSPPELADSYEWHASIGALLILAVSLCRYLRVRLRGIEGEAMKYRIRWANVSVANGRYLTRKRMCIAERRAWLGWWPCIDADWTFSEERAQADIENDKFLRSPMPRTKLYD